MTAFHGEIEAHLQFQIVIVIQRHIGEKTGGGTHLMETGQIIARNLRSGQTGTDATLELSFGRLGLQEADTYGQQKKKEYGFFHHYANLNADFQES